MFWSYVLLCGLSLTLAHAEHVDSTSDTETTEKTSCPDMCDLLRLVGSMEEKIRVLENQLKESSKEVEELKNKGNTPVSFSATVNTGGAIGPFSVDKTLVYNTVILNIGSGYNPLTGIFTAPVSGVYYFSFFYHAGGNKVSYLKMVKNSEYVVGSSDHASPDDGADNGANAAVLQLQQGDNVFIQLVRNHHVWATLNLSSFNGFLLRQI